LPYHMLNNILSQVKQAFRGCRFARSYSWRVALWDDERLRLWLTPESIGWRWGKLSRCIQSVNANPRANTHTSTVHVPAYRGRCCMKAFHIYDTAIDRWYAGRLV